MDIVLGIFIGIGLSAACGFRVFVPPLVMSIAALSGHLELSSGFEWMGSWPALIAFALATVVEIAGYYVPWVDNLLDAIAFPAAVVAGVVVTASAVSDLSPFLKYTLAVIAGGGAAATVKGMTTIVRAASSLATGGAGNPVVSTGEAAGSVALSILAIVLPIVAAVIVVVILFFAWRKIVRKLRERKAAKA